MKLTPKTLIKLSMIIDKMGIADEIANIDKETNEEVGKALISIIISKIYKAENEIYEWISEVKGISVDEAKDVDFVQLISDLKNSELFGKFKSFLPHPQD